jgi:hypothetical protein
VEEVREVPGVTDEDMRLAALERLRRLVTSAPDLGPGEFARKDAEQYLGVKDSMAERELERLVKAGVLDKGLRYDARTGRTCLGYWFWT